MSSSHKKPHPLAALNARNARNANTSPAIVLDIGHYYTKAGAASNLEPAWVLPTCVANHIESVPGGRAASGLLSMEASHLGMKERRGRMKLKSRVICWFILVVLLFCIDVVNDMGFLLK